MTQPRNAPLRDDVKLLGELLGDCLHAETPTLFSSVEQVRHASAAGRDAQQPLQTLQPLLANQDDASLLHLSRSFNQFLNLANIAEQCHRERLLRRAEAYPGEQGNDRRLSDVLSQCRTERVPDEQISATLSALSVELVLTAHPTEVTRRTLIRKYDSIADLLMALDRADLNQAEREVLRQKLRAQVLAVWHTDEIRRAKPTPVDEAKWGFATIEQSLWQAVPNLVRTLQTQAAAAGISLPADWSPVSLASWMGGDRDGNPNVTAAVTQEVLLLARWMATDLYLRDVETLLADLSMTAADEQVQQWAMTLVADPAKAIQEPYRCILRHIRQQLREQRRELEQALLLNGRGEPVSAPDMSASRGLQQHLQTLDRSLRHVGLAALADGHLQNTLIRLRCFGVSLLRLDVRQESGRHEAVIAAICDYLQLGDYRTWSETQRQDFLLQELASRRPLIDDAFYASDACDDDIAEVLACCRVLADQQGEGVGAYVISMARAPSDVLAVMLLQKLCGVRQPLRVVPLFETLDDLEGACATMSALLDMPAYKARVAQGQEVMIGYSDSAKDAGFLGAAWAQFRAQEALAALFKDHGIALTLFHGRGGSVSRGGAPTRMALLSQPPGSVCGRLRITEQGEVIRFKYGRPAIAESNLHQYVAATLEATLLPPPPPTAAWRDEMDRLSQRAIRGYRNIVRDDPALVRYLRTVTPETELSRLSLGSRPARRASSGGIASLRAIPWVFAWTQMRLMLPAWLGTGAALEAALRDQQRQATVRDMAAHWPFFQGAVNMLEMVLAKADSRVALWYEQRLAEQDPDLLALGERLRQRLAATVDALSRLTGRDDLLADNPDMRWSIRVRDPYLDPLHLLQAELMARLRQHGDDEPNDTLENALMVTIAGIAAGLRNTG